MKILTTFLLLLPSLAFSQSIQRNSFTTNAVPEAVTHTWTVGNTYQNGPYIHEPLNISHLTNALTILLRSNILTGPVGTFSNAHPGDNYILAGNDQYQIFRIVNDHTAVTSSFAPGSHINETNAFYYPTMDYWTDVSGVNQGAYMDSGGCLGLIDSTGNGASPPLVIAAVQSTNAFSFHIGNSAGIAGPYFLSINSLAAWFAQGIVTISSAAAFNTVVVNEDSTISVGAAITNDAGQGSTIPIGNTITIGGGLGFKNNSGTTTAATNGAGASSGVGAGGTATLDANSDDSIQILNITTGTTPAVNALVCTITFANAKTTTNRVCILGPYNAAGTLSAHSFVNLYPTAFTTTNYQIWSSGNALTASQSYKMQTFMAQ